MERIDEGRTKVVPPLCTYYIKDSLHYLLYEFAFEHYSANYSNEAHEMILRVVPLFNAEDEKEEFEQYIKTKGFVDSFSIRYRKSKMNGEALNRYDNTSVDEYEGDNYECISGTLNTNKNMVINFAKKKNKEYDLITQKIKTGKMLVDWLTEWRISSSK